MRTLKTITAFVAVDPANGDEGICSMRLPAKNIHGKNESVEMPMIGADEDRVRSLKKYAEGMSKQWGITIKLVRFSSREDLETIKPDMVGE